MKNWWKHTLAAGIAVAILGAGMAATPAFADPVKDRKAAMKNISKANKALVAYSKGKGDKNAAMAAAKKIASIAKGIPDLFPKGSGKGYGKTTRSKPEIWADWAKFKKANDAMIAAASAVSSRTQMGTDATLRDTAGAVRKTCGGCHKPFRGPKLKKKKM